MTREEAKRRAELYSAFAEGKIIQFKTTHGEWVDLKPELICGFSESFRYRIKPKPKPKYRPFKTQEECWSEMHKHPDFGWVIAKDSKIMYHIYVVGIGYVLMDDMSISFPETFAEYEFTDGEPFGIKEE